MVCVFMFKEVITLFSYEMCVFIIKRYFETKSYKTVHEFFKEKFGDEQTLLNSIIKHIIKRFEVYFHLEDA